MRGLAWDDHSEQLKGLQSELRHWNVTLDIEEDLDEFAGRLLRENWDFVVTDLVDDRTPTTPLSNSVGVKNAREAAKRVGVVFVVTGFLDRVNPQDLSLPHNVILKSKTLSRAWLAGEICEALRDRGLFVDEKQVFLIYGHDRHADGAHDDVKQWLSNRGLTVQEGTVATFTSTIPQDLISMMQPCAAIIAICTPDDAWDDGTCVPRGNVLYEMGVAVGLARGLERLIILQKWGPKRDQQAELPSDFGGSVTIRFSNHKNAFDTLSAKLERLGVPAKKPLT